MAFISLRIKSVDIVKHLKENALKPIMWFHGRNYSKTLDSEGEHVELIILLLKFCNHSFGLPWGLGR